MEVTICNSKRVKLRNWTCSHHGDSSGITINQLTNTKQQCQTTTPCKNKRCSSTAMLK